MKVTSLSLFAIFLLISIENRAQWIRKEIAATSDLTHISVVGSDTILVSGFEGLFRSFDKGNTWTVNTIDIPESYFYKTHFFNSKVGIGVGPIVMANSEVVARTVDGGTHWELASIYNGGSWPREFNDIDFPTSDIGYVAGRNGRILRTQNAGIAWTSIVSDGTTNYLAVDFDTQSHGYILSGDRIEEVADSKILETFAYNPFRDFIDMHVFGNGNIAFISNTYLWMKENGVTNENALPFSDVSCMLAMSANTIYVGTQHGLYVTYNAGEKWEFFKETSDTNIRSIFMSENGFGILAGSDGTLYRTENGGGDAAPIPKFNTTLKGNCELTKVYLNNETSSEYEFTWLLNGEAVSNKFSDSITFTQDFSGEISLVGKNGTSADTLTQYLTVTVEKINLSAGEDIYACYDEPVKLAATSNFPVKWSPSTGLSDPNILAPVSTSGNTIEYTISASNQYGCVASSVVTVHRAAKMAPMDWQKANVTTRYPIEALDMVDENIGYAIASNKLLRTDDGGANWIESEMVFPLDHGLVTTTMDVDFITVDTGFVLYEYLYKTIDGGKTYSEDTQSPPLWAILDIEFSNPRNGYLAGNNGGGWANIYHTTDGGETWQQTEAMIGRINSIEILPNGHAIAVGTVGEVAPATLFLISTDGNTWQEAMHEKVPSGEIFDINFIDNQVGYAVGADWIWKTIDGGLSWARDYFLEAGNAIQFYDKDNGFVLGGATQIYQTVNGGECWQLAHSFDPLQMQYSLSANKHFLFCPTGRTGWEEGIIWRGNLGNLQLKKQTISFPALGTLYADDETITLSGTASSGLLVTYTSSDPAVASVEGNILTIHRAGEITLIATQEGDDIWANTGTISQTVVIEKSVQAIDFTLSTNKTFGDDDELLLAIASSGLPVSFESSNTAVATIENDFLSIKSAGVTEITATQAGNDKYKSISVQVELTVEKADQFLLFDTTPQEVSAIPDVFSLEATASSGLPVQFESDNPAILSVTNATAKITGTGQVTITANQPGNGNYEAALHASKRYTIAKASQEIEFQAIETEMFTTDASFVLEASSTSGLPVHFESGDPNIIAVTGQIADILASGEVTITAYQPGGDFFNAATPVAQSVIVLLPVGIQEEFPGVRIYPNPAIDVLYIDRETSKAAKIIIIDILGRVILRKDFSGLSLSIDLDNFTSGLYTIRFATDTQTHVAKFLKR